MSEFLLYYKRPDPTTWVYLSSFLTIGLYFVFHRFWSIRNLDIVLLILLAPGLLMVHEGRRRHLREMESGEIASLLHHRQDGSQHSETYDKPHPNSNHDVDGPGRMMSPPYEESSGGRSLIPRSVAVASVLVAVSAAQEADDSDLSVDSLDGDTRNTATISTVAQSGNVQSGGSEPADPSPSTEVAEPPTVNPSPVLTVQQETNLPLVTEPQALDERLEATTLDPDQTESEAEISAKQLQR
ncbi:MAG: hypothetical protein KDB00_26225, partial [Planctomycetales bacterium]|nr:hypothetical protein [Planctomycetales bacterium]